MKINLFFNYYKTDKRQDEIDYCLKMNKQVFDKVIIVSGRPTFKSLFELTKEYPDDINVFCNSDIYFPEVELLRMVNKNECYALTRYEIMRGNVLKHFGRIDSQDAWVFRGSVKEVNAEFTMGMWGCDNKLAYELERSGYKVLNPSLSIITVHVHKDPARNHNRTEENTVPGPYKQLHFCEI